jgi:hypothetical protein
MALTSDLNMSTNANASSVGTYYVRPSGGASDKYYLTYVDGQLVVSDKTPQTIAWGQDFSSAAINQFID